jgi:hypothetical protein
MMRIAIGMVRGMTIAVDLVVGVVRGWMVDLLDMS